MNKQKYLAELQRLLVFMTEEDREFTVRRYGEIFDAIDSGAEITLGTPTQETIRLSRGYEPGRASELLPALPVPPEPESENTPEPPEEKKDWESLPDYEVPPTPAPRENTAAAAAKPAAAPAVSRPAAAKKTPAPAVPEEEDEDDWPELPRRAPRGPYEPATVIERSVPLGLGIVLFILIFLALGIPLMLLCIGLTALLLAPGGLLLFGAYLVFVGGLWSLSVVADAILLFGAALVVLSIAIMLLWLGIWAAFNIWLTWGKALVWTAGELLGRRVTVYE